MSNTFSKLGFTFQQLHRKVQFEIERMADLKRREEAKEQRKDLKKS